MNCKQFKWWCVIDPTVQIRVWRGVKKFIEELRDEYGFSITDIASTLLIEALRNEHVLTYTLQYWFEIGFDEACETAVRISDEMNAFLEEEEEEIEEEEGEKD